MAVQSQFQELKKKRCVIFQDESPCHAWNLILRQRAQYIPQQITVAHHHVSEKGLEIQVYTASCQSPSSHLDLLFNTESLNIHVYVVSSCIAKDVLFPMVS